MANEPGIATRLVEAMKDRGYGARRGRWKVDVSALADAAGVSYEMARRYLHGTAVPAHETQKRIEEWLTLPAGYLEGAVDLAGNPAKSVLKPDGPAGEVNDAVLQQCVTAVLSAIRATGAELTDEQTAQLVAWCYEDAMEGQSVPNERRLQTILRVFI